MRNTTIFAALFTLGTVTASLSQDAVAQFKPIDFPPNTGVSGFVFPAPASTIDAWVHNDDLVSMASHAWGLWVGVNMSSGERVNNQDLRIFETWSRKEELGSGSINARRSLTPRPLRQFRFQAARMMDLEAMPAGSPVGFVDYDPTAADHIKKYKLMSKDTLNGLIVPGKISNVPDFPATAISLKVPTIAAVSSPNDPGFFKLPVWHGPPPTAEVFGPNKWDTFVFINMDPSKASTGDGSLGRGSDARKPENTYSINDFIHFQADDGIPWIVVGFHMTTREITHWTWQSFWWTPDPWNPPAPSSKLIADARPQQLLSMGAPAHYAVALAYSMRTSKGANIFGYNPYLEGPLSGLSGQFQFGVQSNCMSCHANAAYLAIPSDYVGNENVDIAGPQFQGHVRLDFLYSLR
jgi:hypothetical protein